jgi:hypothetical protein
MAPPVARVLDSTASLPATFEFDATPSKRRHVPAAVGATSSATASRSVHDILSALDKLTSPLVDAARSPRVPLTLAADVPERRLAPLSQSKAFALDLSSSGGNRLGLSAADDDDDGNDYENGTYDENVQSPQREPKSVSDADAPPTATIDVRSGGMPTDVPTRSTSSADATTTVATTTTTTPARSTFAPQTGLRLPPTVLAARWANERAAAIAAAAPDSEPRAASAAATRAAETSAQRAASGNATPAPLNNAAANGSAYARVRESPLLASPPVVNKSRASPRASQPPAAVVARDAAALSSANESVCDGERLTARIHDALKSGAVGGMRDGWLLSLTMLEKSLRKDSLLLDSIVTEALVEARNETADGVAKLLADIGKLTERVTALPASIGAGSVVSAAAVPSAAPPTDVFKVPQQVFKPAKGKSDEGAAAAATTPATTPALSQAASFLTDVANDAAAAAATSAAVVATTQPLAPKKVRFEIGGDDDKTDVDGAQQATPVAEKTPMFGFPKTPTAGADNSGNSSKADEPAKTDKPLFSFGAPKTTPASSADDDAAAAKPSKPPLFEFGAAKKDGADGGGTPTSKPAFIFGAATPAGASAASGDGSDKKKRSIALTDSTQPKFGLLSTPSSAGAGETAAAATSVAAKPIFEFGKSASTPTPSDGSTPEATGAIKKPVFQFGAAAAKTDAAATPSSTTGGAFQFGAATSATTAPTTTSTTTEPAKVGAKPFMFGAASATPTAAAATSPTTGAAAKPFQFGSSGSTGGGLGKAVGVGGAMTPAATAATPAFGFTKPGPAFGLDAATKPAFGGGGGGGGGGGVSFGFGAAAASTTPAATGNAPFQFGAASSTPAAATATTPAFQFGGAKPTPAAANPFGGGGGGGAASAAATPAFGFGGAAFGGGGFGAASTSSGGDDGGGDEDPNSPFAFRPTQGRKRVVARRKK